MSGCYCAAVERLIAVTKRLENQEEDYEKQKEKNRLFEEEFDRQKREHMLLITSHRTENPEWYDRVVRM